MDFSYPATMEETWSSQDADLELSPLDKLVMKC